MTQLLGRPHRGVSRPCQGRRHRRPHAYPLQRYSVPHQPTTLSLVLAGALTALAFVAFLATSLALLWAVDQALSLGGR